VQRHANAAGNAVERLGRVEVTDEREQGDEAGDGGHQLRQAQAAAILEQPQGQPHEHKGDRTDDGRPAGEGPRHRVKVAHEEFVDAELPAKGVFGQGERGDEQDQGGTHAAHADQPAIGGGGVPQGQRTTGQQKSDGGVGLHGDRPRHYPFEHRQVQPPAG
jgi:hypothetical protein